MESNALCASLSKAEAFSRFKFFFKKLKPRTPIFTLNSHYKTGLQKNMMRF
ncbi:MAG: hypothetical protein KAI83_18380 [Thiomargarita sp.]|nr:hypothetical protein [Thiomargarita sp.]